MDIAQEVSQSVPTTTSTLNSPTIQQRRVSTSVVVDDGQTVAIGGLIRDNRQLNRTGIPWLKDAPGVGALFGTSDDQVDRTELLVLIKPHVIRNAAARHVGFDVAGCHRIHPNMLAASSLARLLVIMWTAAFELL